MTGEEHQGHDEEDMVETKLDADQQVGGRDDGLNRREEESVGSSAGSKPVDNAVTNDSISRADGIEGRVRETGLRTVRSLVNGGLALFALGALSPVGLLLRHLDDMKTGEVQDEQEEEQEESKESDSGGETD
ncbi:hypothetical protein QM012_006749 [Aureobasidium pullulans]|uniref:Uncharacterized protein n=1 Tax=Aureobasidium pullulans TaxID=5580 RepID=A0ABR0TPZ0_AURPU